MYIWTKTGISSYLLETPYMNVLAEKEYTLPKLPFVTAISWNKYLDKN